MTAAVGDHVIERLPREFDRWRELLDLILRSFDTMHGVVDPPSSVLRLTPQMLADRSRSETCFLASSGERLAGCVFAAERPHAVYIGKLAVDPVAQGRGLGRRLIDAVGNHAWQIGKPVLELETRVELTANHAMFRHMGFVEVARHAHPGFDRPTSITFRKTLS